MVFEPAAVVPGDAVFDLVANALHAGEEFLFGSFVPLLHGRPFGAVESSLCQELGFVHLLGRFHELRIREVRVAGAVDDRGGFLPQLVNVGTIDAVLADEEHAFLHGGVRCLQGRGSLCCVSRLQSLGQFGVGQVLDGNLVAFQLSYVPGVPRPGRRSKAA